MVLERVVSYLGTSVSERTVASIFRLQLPCIALVAVVVLWYVMCGFFRRYQRFGVSCCLHLHVKTVFYFTHTNNVVCIYLLYKENHSWKGSILSDVQKTPVRPYARRDATPTYFQFTPVTYYTSLRTFLNITPPSAPKSLTKAYLLRVPSRHFTCSRWCPWGPANHISPRNASTWHSKWNPKWQWVWRRVKWRFPCTSEAAGQTLIPSCTYNAPCLDWWWFLWRDYPGR